MQHSRQTKQSVHDYALRANTSSGQGEKFPAPSAVINEIQFGVFKASDIAKMSHVKVHHKNLYNFNTTVPFTSGCLDRRLGVSNKKDTCETCGKKLSECIGHFGNLVLELPVFHIGFFKDIVRILQAICKECGKVLMDEEDEKRKSFIRSMNSGLVKNNFFKKTVLEHVKKCKKCPNCGAPNGTVRKLASAFRLVHDLKQKNDIIHQKRELEVELDYAMNENKLLKEHFNKASNDLNPLRVLNLFKRIPKSDYPLLNLNSSAARPQDLIVTQMPIPPVCIRPSVQMGFSGSNEDDLTIQLGNICHINNTIRTSFEKGHPTSIIIENWDFLQTQVALFLNSDLPGFPRSAAAKPIRALTQRLKGKMGRFRGNLSGKRVDFSARTVISPDPNLRVDQVGVPFRVAKIMTYPERVTKHNLIRLRKAVINGCLIHPGANFVEFRSGARFFLRYCDRKLVASKLNIGDVVERHMVDNDVVLFNRQPSLHRMSIMSHRAKILKSRTFRFNECVCAPYNADFDGDEMNLHLPQTEEARAEAGLLMCVPENLVSPRHGTPLITATQDFLSAAFLLTNKNVFYSRSQFCAIIVFMNDALVDIDLPKPVIIKPIMLWTGKQVFSVLLKSDAPPSQSMSTNISDSSELKYSSIATSHPDTWPKLNIELHAANFEPKKDDPLHDCMNIKDGHVIIRNSQLLCGNLCKKALGGGRSGILFNLIRDYSSKYATDTLNKLAKLSARWLTNRGFSIGISDVTPGVALSALKTKLILNKYENVRSNVEKFEHGKLTVQPGANIEETLEGLLLKDLNDIRGQAGSYCLDSLDAATNSPLIMAICGSKGSKINIAQMVACVGQQVVSGSRITNGFYHRTLPHFGLDARGPEAKGFVASSFYTGLNASEFFFHTMGGREGLVDTAVKTAETGYMQRRLVKALEDLCLQYDGTVRTSDNIIVQFKYGDDGLNPMQVADGVKPVHFYHVYSHIRTSMPCKREKPLYPSEFKELIISERLKIECINKDYYGDDNIESSEVLFYNALFHFLFNEVNRMIDLYDKIKLIINNENDAFTSYNSTERLCKTQVLAFITECIRRYNRASVEPGCAVGALSAQSIGEPGTQMTLKTFHFAGVASMNITLGVPRLKEIMNASVNINSPIITAELVCKDNVTSARIVKGRIETTKLGDIAQYIQISVSSDHCFIEIELDFDTVAKLQLSLTVDSVVQAIVKHRPLKLKEKHVSASGLSTIHIAPPRNSVATGSSVKRPILFELEQIRGLLPAVIVCGINGLKRAVISDTGNKQYKLLIEGENLLQVMATEGVIGTKTTCNHVMAVNQVLGIEAARQTIINEIKTTMDGHGLTVDPRHVSLLADLMSYTGTILGITRFGIAKMKSSVLMLASFEQTADHLFDAALRGKKESLCGVSETIITGKPIPIGTGKFQCYNDVNMNQEKLKNNQLASNQYNNMFTDTDLLLY